MKIRVTRSIVPNLFTLMNIFMGFTAIIYISHNDFNRGALFILAAAVFDSLDGVVARLLKSASELGAELDSLCDAVSFGVAPAFMLYQVFFYQYESIGIILASFPALAGVVRLARFNVQLTGFEDKLYFRGLPIPSGALLIVSYIVFFHLDGTFPKQYDLYLLSGVSIVTSLVMVSNIRFDNMPRPTKKSIKQKPMVFVLFIIGLVASIITKGWFIFPFMVFIIIASSMRHFVLWLKQTREAPDDIDESDDSDKSFFDI
jgi:CDP-diacylglycerol---serine O-phosphatidyltransferase